MLSLGEPQEISKARTSISALEGCKHIAGVLGSDNPVTPFPARLNDVRGADKVPIFKASELISSTVAKHDADAGPCFYRHSAEVSGYRLVKALLLSSKNAKEIKVGMAFTMKIHI